MVYLFIVGVLFIYSVLVCVSVRSYRTPSRRWSSRRKFCWHMQKNSTSSTSQQSWYSLRWMWHASITNTHTHTFEA